MQMAIACQPPNVEDFSSGCPPKVGSQPLMDNYE